MRIETRAPAETLREIGAVLRGWQARQRFSALGIATFGPADLDPRSPTHGTLVGTPKPGWDGIALLPTFAALQVPLGLDTDVNAAARAEGTWGGARGLNSYAYVTVGTGIGIGTMIGQLPVSGLGHSEAGHMRIPRLAGDTWPGSCPFHRDCAEGLASGPAIRARTGREAGELPPDHPVWDTVAHALGALLHNLVLTAAPERILVGGGVVAGQPHLLARVRSALLASLNGYAQARAIARAPEQFLAAPALGERAGSLGAIALAQRALRGQECL